MPTRRFLFLFVLALIAAVPARAGVVERFETDPIAGGGANPFVAEGDVAARFQHLLTPPRFPGDRPGTLRVLHDTTLPTARIATPLGRVLSFDDDFELGAIMVIRSDGFAADPNGFSQIAFGLWNAATTGMGRTSYPSDAYDLVEVDFFANVTSFGGPFLTGSVAGGKVGDNAFNNFAFSAIESALPFDAPILIQARCSAATRRLRIVASRHLRGALFQPLPGAAVEIDLTRLAPTFLVDLLGIAGYGEGWPSLRAEVDYELLYEGPLPAPFAVGRPPRAQGR
jgi:hypothetical protein